MAQLEVTINGRPYQVACADGEEQLFRYAANQGVPLLVLTDGNVWAMYLSMAEGLPNERRFFHLELQKTNASEGSLQLRDLLSKDRVVSGEARREAERRHAQIRDRLHAREGILAAWRALLSEPDEMLRELVAQRVEDDSGSKPASEDVESFLRSMVSPSAELDPETTTKDNAAEQPHPRPQPKEKYRLVGFVFHDRHVKTGSGRATLTQIIQTLESGTPDFMERLAAQTVGKRRRLVAKQRSELYDKPHLAIHSIDLGNGWWMGTNLSNIAIRKHIATVCRVAGVHLGTQLTLIEE